MRRSTVRLFVAGVFLLLAVAPEAEPTSPKAQCNKRCSVVYSFCLKRSTDKRSRTQCKLERTNCKGLCGK
jgi:hypothetical protein